MAKTSKNKTVLIGHINVDSGQVMIVDPCYLDKWVNDDFNYRNYIKNKKTGEEIACWDIVEGIKGVDGKGKINWSTPLPKYGNKSMNDLAFDEETWEKKSDYPDAGVFSYSGACGVTCGDDGAGEIGINDAVASRTYYGDGQYPVYVVKDENGRIKKMVIDFLGEKPKLKKQKLEMIGIKK